MSLKLLRKNYGTRKDLEQQGVWVKPIIDEESDIAFLLARMFRTNRKWAGRISKVYRQHKRKIDTGAMPDEQANKISLNIFCESVLLDWRGITTDEGKAIPYTPEEGIKLLNELPDLYDYLKAEAEEAATYQDEVAESTAEKSASI